VSGLRPKGSLRVKYGIRQLKPRQYATMSSIGVTVRSTSQTPETMRIWPRRTPN